MQLRDTGNRLHPAGVRERCSHAEERVLDPQQRGKQCKGKIVLFRKNNPNECVEFIDGSVRFGPWMMLAYARTSNERRRAIIACFRDNRRHGARSIACKRISS